MADLDVTSPADDALVSAYPANERAHRTVELALLAGTAFWGGTSGGSANSHTVTVANTGLALTSGLRVSFIAGYANTSDTLLTVNALAAKAIVDRTGVALFNGAIQAGRIHEVVYNGTYFMLLDAAYGVAQTLYDLLTPIGTIRFCNNDTAPVVPPGLTATWTEITSSATFGQVFSIKTGKTTGTSEGSATAALPNHIHSPGNMSVTVTAGATDVAAGSLGSRASPGIYDVNGNTGNPTTSPAISFDFPRHYVKAYFRSA